MALSPEGPVAVEPRRALLKILLRIGIGVAVIGVLVWRTPHRDQLTKALREADKGWVAAAAALLLVGIVLSALRWRAYLDALELSMPLRQILRLYFVGTFFNAFLPSGVGGDGYKAVRIGKARGNYTNAFASVFLDRFAGFMGLALVGLLGVTAELASDHELRVAKIAFVLSAGMLSAGAILLVGGERLLGRGRVVKEHGIGGKLRGAVRAIHEAGRHPPAAARGYLFGVAFQTLVLAYHFSLVRALHLKGVPIGGLAGVVVVASLATMIPLSPGGLGCREVAYVWALTTFGVARAEATAFAALVLAILLVTSAIGGLIYLVAGGEVRAPV